MGLFDAFKKKKQLPRPLPPPPMESPSEFPPLPEEELQLPEFPRLDKVEEETPEVTFGPPPITEEEKPSYHRPEVVEPFKPLEIMKRPSVLEPHHIDAEIPEDLPVERERPEGAAFVSANDYRAILEKTNIIRERLVNAESMFRRIGEIKIQEEKEFDKWRSQLEKIEKQLSYAERLIAKAA